MRYWLFPLLLIPFIVKGEDFYKGADSAGVIRYSDKPFPGAKPYSTNPLPLFSPSLSSKKEIPPMPTSPSGAYQLNIVSPENNQIFSVDMQSIPVKLSLTPPLPPNAKIRIILNGNSLPLFSDLNEISLEALPRGTYQLQAELLTPQQTDQISAKSSLITFYQQRPFVKK